MAPQAEKKAREVLVAAVVLAAGQGTRMGEQKLLLPLGGRRVVQWVVDAALGAKVTETLVVVGHDAEAVRSFLRDRPARIVANPDYAEGMSTSLAAGVRAADARLDAAVFLLGDQPFVTSELINRLVKRFRETRAWIVRPEVGGRPVHPVLMSKALFPEILEQGGDIGGREIVQRHLERQVTIAAEKGLLALDIDTLEDYETASRYLASPAGPRPDLTDGGGDEG